MKLGYTVVCVPDVAAVHGLALQAGAKEMAPPQDKPWRQRVAHVRCPDGILVALCTPASR